MGLKLSIVSEQRSALGRDASIVLGVGGGSIGRAHDNDWVLPDAQCYLSAHHARVQFRHGSYYLLDCSTNGTYVNGGTVPISRRNIYPLRDGDSLRLGEYEIAVNIDLDTAEAPRRARSFRSMPSRRRPGAAPIQPIWAFPLICKTCCTPPRTRAARAAASGRWMPSGNRYRSRQW